MTKSKKSLKVTWQVLVVLMIMFGLVTTALAATWVGNKMGPSASVWAPQPSNLSSPWENGNPKGYREGDTAAIVVPVTANVSDGELLTQICLDQTASQTGAYAFTNVEPWDKTLTPDPSEFPNGSTVDYADGLWDTSHPAIWGHNINIVNVEDNDPGGLCGADYIGWRVTFAMMNDGLGYIAYGAHIATPGDPLPYGGSVSVVPDGMGALAVNGVFQVRNAINANLSGADKTVNFQSKDLLPPPTAIALMDFGASTAHLNWITAALALIAFSLGLSFFVLYRKSKSV
jgi:hypothetical protein